jgi:Ala-tRNA(Pro) deacylase
MALLKYLDSKKVRYELMRHRPAYTAQQIAAEEHVSGMQVAKPVLIKADNKYYLCVLPACYKIVFPALAQYLRVEDVRLADECEMAEIFGDCQLGAEPPFGHLYGIDTLMDESLEQDVFIVFQAETHEHAVRMRLSDYKKLANPTLLSFSYHERS